MARPKVDVTHLSSVSETMLWTLYCRASETSRSNPEIDDRLARPRGGNADSPSTAPPCIGTLTLLLRRPRPRAPGTDQRTRRLPRNDGLT